MSDDPNGIQQEQYERGLTKRTQVMGEQYVSAALDPDAFGADFQRFLTAYAWGSAWGRGNLTDRERHMVTLAILAALGREKELESHIRATANTGVSERDLSDVLHQVAVYAGVPAGLSAVNTARRVFAARDADPQK